VLGDNAVSRLVASMLFVLLKQLHTKQGGKAGVTAPATRSSGRTRQGPSSSSASAPVVRIATAVSLCNGMHSPNRQAGCMQCCACRQGVGVSVWLLRQGCS
jgi:hypothetical protein